MWPRHFQLDFHVRPFDMMAGVLLKSFHIEDLVGANPPPDFRKIASSDVLYIGNEDGK